MNLVISDENHGNPNNRSAIYTSLLVGNNYAICRSGIQANHTSPYEYYPLSNKAVWTLNGEYVLSIFYLGFFNSLITLCSEYSDMGVASYMLLQFLACLPILMWPVDHHHHHSPYYTIQCKYKNVDMC